MRRFISPVGVALSAFAATGAAFAQQYGAPVSTPPTQPYREPAATTPTGPPLCHAGISNGARKALVELQTVVFAKDTANIPAKLAGAQAVAKSNDDKCFIGLMQLKAAADSNDLKGMAVALEAQLASGSIPAATIAGDFENLGRMHYNARAYTDAGASFERALQLAPTRGGPVILLAQTRVIQKRGAEALPLFQKAIALEIAAGRKPEESWYRRPVAIAYDNKNPLALSLTRDWVAAYPNAKNWRDAIRVHAGLSGLGDVALIDMYRLARLNAALAGEADYARYAEVALSKGFPGEAKALLDQGFAANAIDRNSATFKSLYATATTKAAGDRAALDAQAKTALAGGTAKSLMTLAEAYYGYGDYARAAELARAAQGKPGVDAELANLRLGMALAASGDKAGAKAALDLVVGPQAEVARYWQTYLATRP